MKAWVEWIEFVEDPTEDEKTCPKDFDFDKKPYRSFFDVKDKLIKIITTDNHAEKVFKHRYDKWMEIINDELKAELMYVYRTKHDYIGDEIPKITFDYVDWSNIASGTLDLISLKASTNLLIIHL